MDNKCCKRPQFYTDTVCTSQNKREELIRQNNFLKCKFKEKTKSRFHNPNIFDFSGIDFYIDIEGENSPINHIDPISPISPISPIDPIDPIGATLKTNIDVCRGNFFLNIKSNFSLSKSPTDEFFFKYFGEEKFDKVNQVSKEVMAKRNQLSENSESTLSEMKPQSKQVNEKIIALTYDAVTNYIVINFIRSLSRNIKSKISKENSDNLPCFEKLTESIKKVFRYIENSDCSDFIKKLFNKYAKEKISLSYLSCKSHEKTSMKNVISTYKTLFCNICKIYDCKIHFLKDERWLDFDNTEGYKDYLYIQYFKKLIELSKSIILSRGENFSNEDNQISLFFIEMQKKEQLLELKEIKSKTTHNKVFLEEDPCSTTCFKNFLSKSDKLIEEWNKARNIIEESDQIYFMKLFEIHKYNPCIISKILKLKRKTFSHNNSCVSDCRIIYFKLLDFDLLSHLRQIRIPNKNNKKISKKAGNSILIKNINKAKKENIIYEYIPCMHPANQACDEKCSCWERGFCEKFCVCNPDLCKKGYFYCNCTSDCRTFQCPCFNAGRECDPDKCKKCTDDNPSNKCVNKSCRLKKFSKTAIGQSIIAGWGLFALENIKKDDLIQEYTGEIIDSDQLEERDMWNNVEEITYIFDLNEQVNI